MQKKITFNDFDKSLKWQSTLENQEIVFEKNHQIAFQKDSNKYFVNIEPSFEVDQDKATLMINTKSLMIEALYVIQATPYRGQVTKESNCIKDLSIAPIKNDNVLQTSYRFDLKATERMVLGGCEEDQNIYLVQVLLLYCKKTKTFYDIKYYYPKSLSKFVPVIASCK